MAGAEWILQAPDGELRVHTGVTGRAAGMGHRLTIAMSRWRATVQWAGGAPIRAALRVQVDSLAVLHGEGGVKALSGPEKALVRSNALKALDAGRFPEIGFDAATIVQSPGGYRLIGTLSIHGQTRDQVIDLHTTDLGDSWRLSAEAAVRQTDFGVKPYSLLMGSLKVADEVTVSFTAQRAKDE
ncbi:YceI family protein [Mycobacterium sp.]|uniref:YceI family protein n=1 Tax=Mycobacterium sp. TaxID=1785 RepID=UPI0025FC3F3B|nr:YceI family protein [Mycobacterium sp.]